MALSKYTPAEGKIVHKTGVDFSSRPSTFIPIHLVQYDDRLPIIAVSLYSGGELYKLPANGNGFLRFGKKNHLFVVKEALGTNDDRSMLYFEVPFQMVTEYGTFNPVVEVNIGGEAAASSSIKVIVDKNSVQKEDVEDRSEYKSLVQYAEEAKTAASGAKESETKAAASASAAASSASAADASRTEAASSASASASSATESQKSATASANSAKAALDSQNTAEEHMENAAASASAAAGSAQAAKTSQTNAASSETKSATSASAAASSEANAKTYAENAKASETTASAKASDASASADASQASATASAGSATKAAASETKAAASATAAETSKNTAANWAKTAESYAKGGTSSREGEDIDNAKYYYEQARVTANSLTGALKPRGSLTFAELKKLTGMYPGDYYNITDAFTSDNTFVDGGSVHYPEGTDVFYTEEGKWNAVQGSGVSGVKGSGESSYRKGLVTISKNDIGLSDVDNTHDNVKHVAQADKVTYALTIVGGGGAVYDGSAAKTVTIPTVPTTMKNPYSLKFTGGSTVTYDGSAERSVAIPVIPQSLKNPAALTFTGGETGSYDGSVAKSVNIPTSLPANGGHASSADSATTATTATKVANKLTAGSKTYDGSSAVTITAADVGALATTGKAASATKADTADALNAIPVDTASLDVQAGTKIFSVFNAIVSGEDNVVLQVGDALEKFQILVRAMTDLRFRFNDSGGADNASWSPWYTALSDSNFTRYVTPSAIGAMPANAKPTTAGTADKVGHKLTITVENEGSAFSANEYVFDGSSDVSFTISPSDIGALREDDKAESAKVADSATTALASKTSNFIVSDNTGIGAREEFCIFFGGLYNASGNGVPTSNSVGKIVAMAGPAMNTDTVSICIGPTNTTNNEIKFVFGNEDYGSFYKENGGGNIGRSSKRWSNLYLSNQPNVTSDRNKKNTILPISDTYEKIFEDLKPVTYRFNDGDRVHTGFIAQDVEKTIEKVGLTSMDFAAFCKDEWDDDETKKHEVNYSLRYGEFIALNTHMIQKLTKEFKEKEQKLTDRISYLESKVERLEYLVNQLI